MTGERIVSLRPHNVETFHRAKQVLREKHQVAIVQATGTGKSFIMLALLEDLFQGKRVLYVVPYKRIGENFKAYKEFSKLTLQFDIKTYNSFHEDRSDWVSLYDAVLIDEFHHMGSDVYGKMLCAFKDTMVANGKYAIAVSATPVRPLDKFRDMGDEAFAHCVVNGVTTEEAIKRGVVKKPIYALAMHDGVDDKLNSEGKIDFYSCIPEVKRLIAEYCVSLSVDKWLVYIPSISAITDVSAILRDIFGNIKMYSISSTSTQKVNEQSISSFIDCEETCCMLSVDMLLEGTHLPVPISGILNFRHIISPNVFWQMIGRIHDANGVNVPMFINIAGHKFYRPTLTSTGLNINSWASNSNVLDLVYDVTSIEVIENIYEYIAQSKKFSFVSEGELYTSVREWYDTHATEDSVSLPSFYRNLSRGYSLNDSLCLRHERVIAGKETPEYHGTSYISIAQMSRDTGISKGLIASAIQRANGDSSVFESYIDSRLSSMRRRVDALGEYKTLSDYYEANKDIAVVSSTLFKNRFRNGWSLLDSLTTPVLDKSVVVNGERYKDKRTYAMKVGVAISTVFEYESKYGWDTVEFRRAIDRGRLNSEKRSKFFDYRAWFKEHGKNAGCTFKTWRNRVQENGNPTDDETLKSFFGDKKIKTRHKEQVVLKDGRVFSSLEDYWTTIPVERKRRFDLARNKYNKGATAEEAVLLADRLVKILEYDGIRFDSFSEMCAYATTKSGVEIKSNAVSRRMCMGKSAEQSINEAIEAAKPDFVDNDGTVYKTWKDYYAANEAVAVVPFKVFRNRLHRGFDPLTALTQLYGESLEYEGKIYENLRDFYDQHKDIAKVSFKIFERRTRRSNTLMEALTKEERSAVFSYNGVTYNSKQDFYEKHIEYTSISLAAFLGRVRAGEDLWSALTRDPNKRSKSS